MNPLSNFIRKDIPGVFNESAILTKHWDRLQNNLQGNILPPYEVLIHPSSACNLCCEWCIGDHVPIEESVIPIYKDLDASKTNTQRLPDTLRDPKKMIKLIDGIINYKKIGFFQKDGKFFEKEFKIENVSFSGLIGEPLVSKESVIEAITILSECKIRTGIFTNGILMDDQALRIFQNLSYVHLSLDAATAVTYSKLKYNGRPSGNKKFYQAVNNLKALCDLKRLIKSDLEINASFILYPENYLEVFDAAKILKNLGVGNMRIKQDISGKKLLNEQQQVTAKFLINKIQDELIDENFNLIVIHQIGRIEESKRDFDKCYITDLMAAVGSDGDLYPCNYHPRVGGASYGSAVENTFENIWEGNKRKELKALLPCICPSVCDPFKNRSNKLLNKVYEIYCNEGINSLENTVEHLNKEV